MFQQQFEVNPAQGIGQEDVAPSVPALCDMMREAGRDGPRCSGHAEPVRFAEIFLVVNCIPPSVSGSITSSRFPRTSGRNVFQVPAGSVTVELLPQYP